MIDLSFLDGLDTPEEEQPVVEEAAEEVVTDDPPALESTEQQSEELLQLKELADNVGSFKWSYDNDDKVHDGIVTQDLLKVSGLKDAVNTDPESGLQTVDTNFLSLAAIGYIAALARIVLGEKADGNISTESNEQA